MSHNDKYKIDEAKSKYSYVRNVQMMVLRASWGRFFGLARLLGRVGSWRGIKNIPFGFLFGAPLGARGKKIRENSGRIVRRVFGFVFLSLRVPLGVPFLSFEGGKKIIRVKKITFLK